MNTDHSRAELQRRLLWYTNASLMFCGVSVFPSRHRKRKLCRFMNGLLSVSPAPLTLSHTTIRTVLCSSLLSRHAHKLPVRPAPTIRTRDMLAREPSQAKPAETGSERVTKPTHRRTNKNFPGVKRKQLLHIRIEFQNNHRKRLKRFCIYVT